MLIKRKVFYEAKKYLDDKRILLFIGARQTGKTVILRALKDDLAAQGEPTFFLNLEDPDYLTLLNEHPRNIFSLFPIDSSQRTTVFIDEIQYLDNPSNFLKYIFDEYADTIKLIVSGSSAFYIDQKFTDSLSGRKKIFPVRTLSFEELLSFRTSPALAAKPFAQLTLSEQKQSDDVLREYMRYGGYPAVVLAPREERESLLRELVYSYAKKDVLETGVRDSATFFKLFKILARQSGNLVNTMELANTLDVSKTAITNYLHIMQKSFHIALVTPFTSNVRKEISKMPKVYFSDLGLLNFLNGTLSSDTLTADNGALLENMTFRMLLDESHHESDIHFWRTTDGNEVDFVIDTTPRVAYEAKTSPQKVSAHKYELFRTRYPDITFSLVSTRCGTAESALPCKDVREV